MGSFLDCTVRPASFGLESFLCASMLIAVGNEKHGLLLGLWL